jgi:hypothetical protein
MKAAKGAWEDHIDKHDELMTDIYEARTLMDREVL